MIYTDRLKLLRRLFYLKAFGYRFIAPSLDISAPSPATASLDELKEQISTCSLCELSKSRKHVLNCSANSAKIMFITDSPSISEDMSGKYLSGVAGDKFSALITQILGLTKDEIYVSSILRCKLTPNTTKISDCYELCRPYLLAEIDILRPKIIVALGEIVFLNLLGDAAPKQSFETIRGSTLKFNGSLLMTTYSPAWLVKNPSKEQNLIDDLIKLKKLF